MYDSLGIWMGKAGLRLLTHRYLFPEHFQIWNILGVHVENRYL